MTDRILVLGGYGVFGGKLCAYLARSGLCEVLVAGRSLAAAEAFCAVHGGTPTGLDRTSPRLAAEVAALAPQVVVDAAGPFQTYGTAPYALARAAIACGAHYIDLSDDAAFTAGITALEREARAAGVTVISGASSVPGLSAAAVQHLATGLSRIERIESTILPGNRAPRGLSVMRAILAQVGHPLPLTRAGRIAPVIGWGGLKRVRLCLPGLPPITRRASYIGAPDLRLFPARFGARTVLFRAGLDLAVLHHGLWLLSLLVRVRLLQSLEPLAPLLQLVAQGFTPFGSDRGGMLVEVLGQRQDGGVEMRRWVLIAGTGDGPHVPSLPARALCIKALGGTLAPGARPCLGEIPLAEILATAEGLDICTGTEAAEVTPVFRSALGPVWDQLPCAVRDLHDCVDTSHWRGEAEVENGSSPLARLLRRLIGFPKAGRALPVQVEIRREGAREVWLRRFGDKTFHSVLAAHGPPGSGQVTERFGPLRFVVDLSLEAGALRYPVTRGWAFGLPLPRAVLPRSQSTEEMRAGRFHFDVAVSMPLVGLIVRYRGWLRPD